MYASASLGVTVSLAVTAAQNTVGAGTDTVVSIENLTGSSHADTLIGNATGNSIVGHYGADFILGAGGNDYLLGGAGDDRLVGEDGNDALKGEDGNDQLGGGTGDDLIDGGEGIDVAAYTAATNRVFVSLARVGQQDTGGAGFDTLVGIENLTGSASDDILEGDAGADIVQGLGGYDFILGGAGDDLVQGGDGRDSLVGNDGADRLIGGNDGDSLSGGAGNDILNGGAGEDDANYRYEAVAGVRVSLNLASAQDTGGAGIDTPIGIENLLGTDFNDDLAGNGLGNALYGFGGDDRLAAFAGNDYLSGGAGSDTFVFGPLGGSDYVADFTNGADRLAISGFGTAHNTAGEVIAAATQVATNTVITLANPGAGTSTIITLAGFSLANLDASDLMVIG